MNLTQEIFNIYDISQHAGPDANDIKSLLIASIALVRTKQQTTKRAKIASIASHSTAILNGVFGINYTYRSDSKIFLFLWYLPAMLFFAKRGFDANSATNILRSELDDTIQQHQKLKNLIRNASHVQTHNIAKTYRNEIQDITNDTITPDQISQTIHHILMKYER